LIGNEEEFFNNFLEKYRIYLAARGSIFQKQKQTIPEQKKKPKKRANNRTSSQQQRQRETHTHTHIPPPAARETTLPEELLKTLLWLKTGLWFINTGSRVTTF
jgi:hypothetical protein